MSLTPDQIAQFNRDGYVPLTTRVLERAHLDRLRDRYDEVFEQRRLGEGLRNLAVVGESETHPGADHSEEVLHVMEMWQLDDEYRKLLDHPPLLDIAESLVGPDIQFFSDQALYKPAYHGGAVHWHQDNSYWRFDPPDVVSIWIPLDDADEENSCMNFIPGSHKKGAATHARAQSERGPNPALLQAEVEEDTKDTAVSVPVRAGYGTVHHCMTLHGTQPNRSPRDRRAMVISYMRAGTRRNGDVMVDNLVLRGQAG